jgi:hypothetical protein
VPTSASDTDRPPAYVSMRCQVLALQPGLLPPGDAGRVDDFWHPYHLWAADALFPDGFPLRPHPQRLRDWRDACGGTNWFPAERARLQAAHVPYYRLTPRLYAYFLRGLKPGPALARVTSIAGSALTPVQRADAVSLASRLHLPGPARPPWPSGWGVVLCGDRPCGTPPASTGGPPPRRPPRAPRPGGPTRSARRASTPRRPASWPHRSGSGASRCRTGSKSTSRATTTFRAGRRLAETRKPASEYSNEKA